MEIRARLVGSVVILDFSGSIDVNSANLVEVVGQCVRDGYVDVLCNFEEVERIDYLGISAILLSYKELINHRGRMKFLNIPAQLRNLFSVTGLDRAVEIFTSEERAVDSFKEDAIIENIKKMQLRRRFKRLPIEIKVELRDAQGRVPSCLNADILNMSAVGAYLYGCDQFALGDRLIMKLTLPPGTSPLELSVKVVWLCDRQIQPQMWPGIGVEFDTISTEDQATIVQFIDRNLSLSATDDA